MEARRSRERAAALPTEKPWGAGVPVSVRPVRESARGDARARECSSTVGSKTPRSGKPKGARDAVHRLNPGAAHGLRLVWESLEGRPQLLVEAKPRGARRPRGRTAPGEEQGLEGRTPGADPGWNKPGRLRGEQGVGRVRNPEDAT
jgi:hypothetical protein